MGARATPTSATPRAVGVLGGTFDPPHIGHLIVACEALWQLALDEVRLVPAHRPPHKPDMPVAPAARRADWLEAAVAGRPRLVVSRIELERDGPSYTVDTLEAMAAAEPGVRLWFILGADQLEGFPGWRDPDRILGLARLAVVARDGTDGDDLAALVARVAPGRADVVTTPEIRVSSTLVRARIAAGRPYEHLLPDGVARAMRADGAVDVYSAPAAQAGPRSEGIRRREGPAA